VVRLLTVLSVLLTAVCWFGLVIFCVNSLFPWCGCEARNNAHDVSLLRGD